MARGQRSAERARQGTTARLRAAVAERLARSYDDPPQAGEPAEIKLVTNYSRAEVPYGVDLAASWAWRFVIIAIAGVMILWTLKFFEVVVFPVLIALFIAALVLPVVNLLERIGLPRKLAALVVVVLGIAIVALLLSFVGQQVSANIDNLSGQIVDGLEEIRKWLRHGPLHYSDAQINHYINEAQKFVTDQGKNLPSRVTEVGTAVGHIVAGFFIVLFSTYFFLADGKLIWAWLIRLFPRTARRRVDTSGHVAFRSLTQFVRATVIVAATDAAGVMIWAAVLGLPFVSAIGVLVFIGAFVPLIGATASGTVAILVALVAKGPVTALLMLAGVVVVQQIEAHVLQPFLMGRFVSVHPLGVIVAIALGVILDGIPGALIAVPLASALNAVVQHLAAYTKVGEDAVDAARADPGSPDPDRDSLAGVEEADAGGTSGPPEARH